MMCCALVVALLSRSQSPNLFPIRYIAHTSLCNNMNMICISHYSFYSENHYQANCCCSGCADERASVRSDSVDARVALPVYSAHV